MSWRRAVRVQWQAAAPRERQLLWAALAVVALALLWWLALAPAWGVHKTAQAQSRALEAQLQQMQQLQQQARRLQALPTLNAPEARQALDASLLSLKGVAQLTPQMERMVVTLKGASAQPLAQWLAAVRQNAHLVPTEARLKRNATGGWDGSVVFVLPAQ